MYMKTTRNVYEIKMFKEISYDEYEDIRPWFLLVEVMKVHEALLSQVALNQKLITFHLLINNAEIWFNVSLITVKSKEGRHGRLHNQCPLFALWFCAYLQLWHGIYSILTPAGLACGAWKLTRWFDQAASSKSPACFSLWNSWESNWSYRHFNS